jgi:pSer/pThr/pTyr-binding forkhead associated (FHA) protein
MAIKRGPDGVPVDVPSVMHKKENKSENKESLMNFDGDEPTMPPNRAGGGDSGPTAPPPRKSSSLFPEDPPTAPPKKSSAAQASEAAPAAEKPVAEDPPTVIARGRKKSAPAGAEPSAAAAGAADTSEGDAMADPIAGWLVVINGPGKGNALTVGFGQNSIGRSPNERVSLDFGDDQISRNSHAIITYDPRGNKFYIQQGSGTNLAYVNNAPVLAPSELAPNSHVTLGDTTLRFVPLCCEGFNWDDED